MNTCRRHHILLSVFGVVAAIGEDEIIGLIAATAENDVVGSRCLGRHPLKHLVTIISRTYLRCTDTRPACTQIILTAFAGHPRPSEYLAAPCHRSLEEGTDFAFTDSTERRHTIVHTILRFLVFFQFGERDVSGVNALYIVSIVVSAQDLLPISVGRRIATRLGTNDTKQFLTISAFHLHGIVVFDASDGDRLADIRDAYRLTHSHHVSDLLLVGLPVFQEHTGRTRHSQQIGIGCQGVLADRVLLSRSRAVLRIMVFHKSHSILAIATVIIIAAYQRPVAFVLSCQLSPVLTVDGIANSIAELEVEGSTGLIRGINPVLNRIRAVPALTY